MARKELIKQMICCRNSKSRKLRRELQLWQKLRIGTNTVDSILDCVKRQIQLPSNIRRRSSQQSLERINPRIDQLATQRLFETKGDDWSVLSQHPGTTRTCGG